MENKILELFLTNHSLKFSEIEKNLSVRSNKLAYYIKRLVSKDVLEKDGASYKLSESAECMIPYLSEKRSVLSVILILIGDKRKAFLYKRDKRPFKNSLSLPGGRLLVGESIKDAVRRIMLNKHNVKAELIKLNSISIEHVKSAKRVVHSFLLIFVSAKTRDKIVLTNIEKNRSKIIPSDYSLIRNDSASEINIKSIITNRY